MNKKRKFHLDMLNFRQLLNNLRDAYQLRKIKSQISRVVAFVAQLVMIILKYISFPADVSTTIVFSSQVRTISLLKIHRLFVILFTVIFLFFTQMAMLKRSRQMRSLGKQAQFPVR